jgi:hypothetical protein
VIPSESDVYCLNRDEALGSIIELSCLIHDEATLVINNNENLSLTLYITEYKGKELGKLPSFQLFRKRSIIPK